MTIKQLFRDMSGVPRDVEIYDLADEENVDFTTTEDISQYKDPIFFEEIKEWRFTNNKFYVYI